MFSDSLEHETSNSLVMDLLDHIKLDSFDEQTMDTFQYNPQQIPLNYFNTKSPIFQGSPRMEDFMNQPSMSPLNFMYSPLSQPNSPPNKVNAHGYEHEAPMFGSPSMQFGDFEGPFGSPGMSFGEMTISSPPMTPMMHGSPMMSHVNMSSLSMSPDHFSEKFTVKSREPIFKCPCGKSFKKIHSLELHSKLHQRDRAFGCEVCHKRFLRPHDLKRHKITHIEGYKPFECTTCGMNFTRGDAAARHMATQKCSKQV